jgi:hypothetical protein
VSLLQTQSIGNEGESEREANDSDNRRRNRPIKFTRVTSPSLGFNKTESGNSDSLRGDDTKTSFDVDASFYVSTVAIRNQ